MTAPRLDGLRIRCPVCERLFAPTDNPLAMPFCSTRCQQIDLGRWLGERYSVPAPRLDSDESAAGEELPD